MRPAHVTDSATPAPSASTPSPRGPTQLLPQSEAARPTAERAEHPMGSRTHAAENSAGVWITCAGFWPLETRNAQSLAVGILWDAQAFHSDLLTPELQLWHLVSQLLRDLCAIRKDDRELHGAAG